MTENTQHNELLEKHLELVLQANEKLNLTRIDSLEEARVLHIEDSLAGVPLIEEAPVGKLADIGSGAGFPGIPLAITTGRDTTLIESIKKKASALEGFTCELKLDNVHVEAQRVEDVSLQQAGEFGVVTARALTQLPSLLELASPLLRTGGWLVAYKSGDVDEELQSALTIQDKLGMKHLKTDSYALSDGSKRTLVVFEKVGEPTVSLPRRPGMAQKRPYRA